MNGSMLKCMSDMKLPKIFHCICVLCITSCQQDLLTDGRAGEFEPKCFKAFVEVPYSENDTTHTRLGLGQNCDAEVRMVLFEKDESIAVIEQSSDVFVEFQNTGGDGYEHPARFEGLIASGAKYYAFYPYSESWSVVYDGFTWFLPECQLYQDDNIDDSAFPMMAFSEGDDEFVFKNLCGVFVLKLRGEGIVSSIVFKGYDAQGNLLGVSGHADIRYDSEMTPQIAMTDESERYVALDCGSGVQLSTTESIPFHIVLPPGEYSSFEIKIFIEDGSVMTKYSSNPLYIHRSQRTTTSDLEFIADSEPNIDGSVDLSSHAGTANCYIVSEPGSFCFKTSKGNSDELIEGCAYSTVVWESFGTSEKPSVGELVKETMYHDGMMFFSTPKEFKEGNALIAVVDRLGNILWSWHIWFVEDEIVEHSYANDAGIMMDRNLGAISSVVGDVESLGLMFQWGRKDPFLGRPPIASTISWPSVRLSSLVTDEYVNRHPTTFYWWYSDHDAGWTTSWSGMKTVFDPCPSGWRVPDEGDQNVWILSGFVESAHAKQDYGLLVDFPCTNYSAWYPAAGWIVTSYQYNSVGFVGGYWTSNRTSDGASYLFFNTNLWIEMRSSAVQFGRNVRCIKD